MPHPPALTDDILPLAEALRSEATIAQQGGRDTLPIRPSTLLEIADHLDCLAKLAAERDAMRKEIGGLTARAEAMVKAVEAAANTMEWYERDGSVGAAVDIFAELEFAIRALKNTGDGIPALPTGQTK